MLCECGNYDKKTWEPMVLAMHKRTRIGCEQLVKDTINTCPLPTISKYFESNYKNNTHQWALWRHFSLLLQVTSTNALESYHSQLKRTSYLHGLFGKAFFLLIFLFSPLIPFLIFSHVTFSL